MSLLALTLIVGSLASGAEPALSTAAAAGRPPLLENPWSLNYGIDRRGKRYGLDYRIRWDSDDLLRSPRAARENLYSPSETIQSIASGLLLGARLDLYGVRLRPFRDLSPMASPALPASEGIAASTAPVTGTVVPRRPRLELDPLHDLRRNGQRELQRFLLREGFNLALPGQRGAPSWQKESAARSVLDAGRAWGDAPDPP